MPLPEHYWRRQRELLQALKALGPSTEQEVKAAAGPGDVSHCLRSLERKGCVLRMLTPGGGRPGLPWLFFAVRDLTPEGEVVPLGVADTGADTNAGR